jgi:hypothetical protein
MRYLVLLMMAVFLGTAVQAQCTIDLSSVPGNAVVESFETYSLGASPPGPCYDTLWVPPNSQDTNGWYVRPHAADLTGVGPTVGSQALRVGYHDRDFTPDTIAILRGPTLQLVPLRRYRFAYLWYWRDDPEGWQGFYPNHNHYLNWYLTNTSGDTIPLAKDTIGYDRAFLNALFGSPRLSSDTFRVPLAGNQDYRVIVEHKVERDFMPSFVFIDSVAFAQIPNDLAYLLDASYTGSGISQITFVSYGNSTTQNDTIWIVLPCDMPLDNVTGFSVTLTPGTTLNPASINGDYNVPCRCRTFTMTSEDGNLTRDLVVYVTPRYTPQVSISAGGPSGVDLSVNNPDPNHSYQWQYSSNNSTWSDISGATGTTYTATQNGYYRVAVDSAGCVGYSNVINITTLALRAAGQKVSVFPNPTVGLLTVQAPAPLQSVSLHTPEGRLLRVWKDKGATLQLNLADLPQGLYLLRVETSSGTTYHPVHKLY